MRACKRAECVWPSFYKPNINISEQYVMIRAFNKEDCDFHGLLSLNEGEKLAHSFTNGELQL